MLYPLCVSATWLPAGKHVGASASEKLSLNITGRGNVLHVKWMYLSCSITRKIKIVITVMTQKALIMKSLSGVFS
jgi:hypothetical protein